MNAAMALDYPDTRENPDSPVDWDKIDINSKEIQGIVKFKRALKDGGTPISMTYVSPSKFQELVSKYNLEEDNDKRKKALEEVLKHFTIEKSYSTDSATSNTGDNGIAKVPSLNGMVFIGDSIMYCLAEKDNTLKNEGAKYLYRGGSTAKYFLGKETADGSTNNCIENNGYFNWDANFKDITNPTGFYLVLGQNFFNATDRIDQMDELIKKIRSKYPAPPIYISSVLHYIDDNGNAERAATKMNEELKVYCAGQNNVYYSDILRGYNDNLREMTEDDNDHPNSQGSSLLVKNIKENIIGTSAEATETNSSGNVTGQMIVQEAEKYVGKLPYVWGGRSLTTGADCSGFVWAILNKLGVINWGYTYDVGIRSKGTEVKSLSEAQAGDVICYNGHVAFYDGKGGIIHEANSNDGCKHSNNAAYTSIITIRRFVTSAGSSNGSAVAPVDDFSAETRQIIMSHINDFNEHNFKQFMDKYPGGYDGYMQSLGGVFAKYGGKGKKIQVNNAGDLQEAAEFVWGLMSIWGFDYWNGSTYWSWGEDEEFEGLHNGAYYPSHSYTGGGWQSGQGNMNDVCADANRVKRTNCNAGIDSFIWTTTLENNSYGSNFKIGERIDKKEDLQVGDFVHFFHEQAETQDSWGHVAIVGEKDPNTGDVILYDSGNRFIRTGRYKIPLSLDDGGAYSNYVKWVGRRQYNLDQTSNRTGSAQGKSTFKVKVATWNETEDIMDAEDPAVSDYHTHTYNITSTTIPYQEIVSKYKMPFNYLWTMLVYSQDKDYVFDLAKLVDNSKIEITIHDNYTETTNIVTDKYTKYKRLYTTAGADVDYKYFYLQTITEKNSLIPKDIKIDKSDTASVSVDAETIYEPSYTNVHTTINRNNTLDIALTLADSWFVKYTKKYTYNELNKITSPSNTEKLGDIVNDSEKVKNDYGGNKEKLIGKAKDKALEEGRDKHGSAFEPSEPSFYNVSTEYTSKVINRSTTTQNIVESSSYVSSVPGGGGISLGTSISNVKTGSLNKNNYVELPSPKSDGDASNPLQGFCIVEDSMMAYVINHKTSPETCTLCLVDINTTQEYDKMNGLYGHGNTIAYDPVNSEIIFPEDGVIQLIKVNKTTKKFEGKRSISPPQRTRSPSQMAYNATHDLFIANSHVYTRDAFYSGGKPIKDLDYNILEGDDLYAGSTSYGNHVYYYFADGYGHSTNYLVVCDLNTGGQVELIRDNMAREGEEASFTSDGTLYLFHGEAGSPFHKTDYNYFYDTNLDTSNVTPGVGRVANDIARYNTGGDYTEMASFEKVFNSHYNARSNIISITEWLFEALEQNSDTEKMADLTRYLLHKATGNDYGEYGNKQFDFEAYGQEDFVSVSSGIYGNTPQEKVWFALRGAGFSEYAVAGAMGNIDYESGGFKTDAIEKGSGVGFGLCQWSYGRRTQLENYAKSKGKNPSDIEIQIEFLLGELTPGGGADGYANYQFGSQGGNWKNSTSVDQATDLYCRYFERPRDPDASLAERKKRAQNYYNEFHGKTAPTAIAAGGVVQYYQSDYSNVSYGSGSIASCGCGPTSFAMVASTLLKKQVTPKDAVSWCGNKYYVSGQGTSWSFFNAASEHFGISKPRNVNSIDEVTNALKSGKLVISSQNKGLFTEHGHFILLSGISPDGKISVKDPNKNNAINKGYNNRLFTTQEINAAAASYWIF